jgi:hypothetical protein
MEGDYPYGGEPENHPYFGEDKPLDERNEYGETLEEARVSAEQWRLAAAENEAEFRRLGTELNAERKRVERLEEALRRFGRHEGVGHDAEGLIFDAQCPVCAALESERVSK